MTDAELRAINTSGVSAHPSAIKRASALYTFYLPLIALDQVFTDTDYFNPGELLERSQNQ